MISNKNTLACHFYSMGKCRSNNCQFLHIENTGYCPNQRCPINHENTNCPIEK